MMPTTNLRNLTRFLLLLCAALVVWLSLVILSANHTIHSTGILSVSASEPSAAITVSQLNSNAAFLGTGGTQARLKPGDYLLSANGAGLSTSQTVHIDQGKTTTVNLNLAKASASLPSVDHVGFVNMDILINSGLTTSQSAAVKTQFFTFDKAVKVVSIDASTVQPGPHDPNSYAPFSLNFTVKLDGTPYRASVAYTGYDSAQLTLFDAQSGQQLYSGPALPGN
jgi:hypothetical protein